jgi:hypothetical protein
VNDEEGEGDRNKEVDIFDLLATPPVVGKYRPAVCIWVAGAE